MSGGLPYSVSNPSTDVRSRPTFTRLPQLRVYRLAESISFNFALFFLTLATLREPSQISTADQAAIIWPRSSAAKSSRRPFSLRQKVFPKPSISSKRYERATQLPSERVHATLERVSEVSQSPAPNSPSQRLSNNKVRTTPTLFDSAYSHLE